MSIKFKKKKVFAFLQENPVVLKNTYRFIEFYNIKKLNTFISAKTN